MKLFKIYKTIQLIIFIIIAAAGVIFILTQEDLFHAIANVPGVTIFFVILWILLVLSFLFIIFDFSVYIKTVKNLGELDHAVHSDPTSGIANRYSCDMIIEKYLDKKLPDNIAALMFDIINIQDINRNFGHLAGNNAIRDFSNILLASANNKCFVGRNGGNKFLAIFEDYSPEKILGFTSNVEKNIAEFNASSNPYKLEYRFGQALSDKSDADSIVQLIAEANKKIYE